jgi:hypothetical protein
MSAASSTTSLGFVQAESDGGSLRSKRTSFMKFMKGRSSMDDDGESGRMIYPNPLGPGPRTPFDGRAYTSSPKIFASFFLCLLDARPGIPSYAPPETPWYLAEDYAPEDVVWDDKGSLRGGTLDNVVPPYQQLDEFSSRRETPECQ